MQLSVTRSEVNGFDRSGARTIKDFPRGSDNNDASVGGCLKIPQNFIKVIL